MNTIVTTHKRQQRDQEFLDMYRESLQLMIKNQVPHPRRAAVRYTVMHGRPHYHVSFERAYRIVCGTLLHNDYSTLRNPLTVAMWQEITAQVREAMRQFHASVAQALEFVLENCRASRFFITEEYAFRTSYAIARRLLGRKAARSAS